tara:strand:+ start:47380 stop:48126 length:747 start_codon:yes stop_codon:yes gene_type:complete
LELLKKSIPNLFTAINFLFGCFATYLAFKNLFEAAFLMVLFGTFFDLFDGFFARLLKVESDFGLQFDSMADLITSGFVPGVVMYNLFLEIGVRELNFTTNILQSEFTFSFAPFALVGFLIPLAAGIRLARYNIDDDRQYDFKGLPAPANALFIVSLPLIIEHPQFETIKPILKSFSTLFVITIMSSIIMNLRLPLFSFKIKSSNLKDYKYQIILFLLSFPTFFFFNWVAVPLLIVIYLILNFIRNSIE